MKKMISVLLAMIMLVPAALADTPDGMLTFDQVQERIETNLYLNLIDIREVDVYDAGHIPMSMNMPYESLETEFQAILDSGFSHMETEIILYGDDAEKLLNSVQVVKGLGFTNVSYMSDAASWPYKMISTDEEIAQAQRILGGMDTEDIYGNQVTEDVLSDYKLTLVNVWATYCNPCLQEMPGLGQLATEMKDQGVQIIGIVSDTLDYYMNADPDKIKLAQEIVKSTGAEYLHIVPDTVVARNLLPQISSVPTTFFLDANGNLVGGVYLGYRDYNGWKAVIEETLALVD